METPRWRSECSVGWILAAATALVFATIFGAPAAATDFFVNRYFEDAHDFAINGICDATNGGGACTLRAAVEEAAASPANDRVFLGNGTTSLTLGPLPDHLPAQGALSLIGNGPLLSSILGNAPADAPLIHSTGVLALERLRIAAFFSESSSALKLEEGASATIDEALFEGNESDQDGGSITVFSSALTVRNTRFANGRGILGGEIRVHGGFFHCDVCVFEGASSGSGGAVSLNDNLGALDVRIERSYFAQNHSTTGGGAISITNLRSESSLLILNTTIYANTAQRSGGGILTSGSRLRIQSSTIDGNVASFVNDSSFRGGGVRASGASVAISNSILSGNSHCAAFVGSNCFSYVADDCEGNLLSNGFNIVRTVTAGFCTVSGGHSTADPLLLPPAYNGGSTITRALAPGSAAIDAGNPAGCQDGPDFLLRDQRGEPRPAPGSGLCDLGAFEITALLFADDFERWEWKWSVVLP